jgi:hypothetical protein
MQTTDFYVNRDVDAKLMLQRLVAYRHLSTPEAQQHLESLGLERSDAIRNYKDTSTLDGRIGGLLCLLDDRERWASAGPFDDCSHWAGNI